MRFLFHSLPLAGHVYPIAAVAEALTERGHEVAWVGSESFLRPLVGPEATVFPTGTRLYRGGVGDHGFAATRSRWEGYIVPHARFTLKAIDGAVTQFRPAAMAVDQHAIAGALAATRHRVPWATLAPTSMELSRPYRSLPKVESWIHGLMTTLWTEAGLPGDPPHDLRFSPHLVIAFTGPALAGAAHPTEVRLVGPALGRRSAAIGFPWERLDPRRRRLLVTLGTLASDMGTDFYERVTEAVRPLDDRLEAIVVSAEETAPPDPPDHVLVVPQVPMLELLPHVDVVLSHGGLNTVTEALAHGVPLVIAPIKSDQPINADQVVAAGAGVRVRFGRSRPDELRGAVVAVLDDPSYRQAAERVRDSFTAAGGAPAAAAHLERLAGPDATHGGPD